jgi:DNA primase
MTGRVPDDTLQRIRERVSIVEVISQYVSLKKAGRSHLGLCPFHSEKTPSFTVNEERGLFHCFGCGAGGTVFTFLMRVEKLEFPEAVEQLAKRAGVELPKREPTHASTRREKLWEINAHAARFYQEQLAGAGGGEARAYLARRGLQPETIQRYGLGFAPATGTALTTRIGQQRPARDLAIELGLLGRRPDGSCYDRFRGRVMFPIRDRRGNTIGFGGRTLGADQPKYLNSPESAVFRKGEGLYGLSEARDAIRGAGRVVVVEGYMDVLQLVQHGIAYTVAVLGTALTERQLTSLRPFGGDELRVFFFFDGDQAGRKAAKRACVEAFKACVDSGLWGRAAFLPDGSDPDSYVQQHGAEATLALLEASAALEDVYFDCVAPGPGASLQERARAAEEVRQAVASAKSDVQRQLLAQRAEIRLGLKEELLRGADTGRPRVVASAPTKSPLEQRPKAELLLIEAMAGSRAVTSWVMDHGTLALFRDAELGEVGAMLADAWEQGGDVARVVEQLPDALAARLTAALVGAGPAVEGDPMQITTDCDARIRLHAQRAAQRASIEELRRAEHTGDDERLRAKLASTNELLRREGPASS